MPLGFIQLPPELRFKIWEATFPPPRIIELHHLFTFQSGSSAAEFWDEKCPLGVNTINRTLACQEQRAVFLSHYKFLSLIPGTMPDFSTSRSRILVDFKRDTILVNRGFDGPLPAFLSALNFSHVRHLAVRFYFSSMDGLNFVSRACELVKYFQSIETLTVVIGEKRRRRFKVWGERQFIEVTDSLLEMGVVSHDHEPNRHDRQIGNPRCISPLCKIDLWNCMHARVKSADWLREMFNRTIEYPDYEALRSVKFEVSTIARLQIVEPLVTSEAEAAFYRRPLSYFIPRRSKYRLDFEELAFLADANQNGTLKSDSRALEDIRYMFVESGERY